MPDLVLEADARLLMLDQRRLQPLQVAGVGVACARDGPAVPSQRRTSWLGLARRLGVRPAGHADKHDQRDRHALRCVGLPEPLAPSPPSKPSRHLSAARSIYLLVHNYQRHPGPKSVPAVSLSPIPAPVRMGRNPAAAEAIKIK